MNILFINSIHMYGGGEVWMVTAARELLKRGHSVTIICRPDADMRPYAEATGATIIPMTIRGDFDPITIWRTARIIHRHNIDVILTNMDKELRFSALASRLCRKRPPVIMRKGVDAPLKNKLHYRWTYNTLASAIVANSEATKRTLLDSAPWLSGERVYVIHNGIDPELYTPNNTRSIRSELGLADDTPVIGFVGRLNVQKGIEYLLKAFRNIAGHMESAHLLMVGEGDLQATIDAFAIELGLSDRVHIAGFRDDIPNVMRSIDVCVLPSLWEGFGIVLIEAMASGKPCVTTQISSMPEIVTDGETGYVVPVKNSDALAAALLRLLQDADQCSIMGDAGRERVLEYFTIDYMIDRYESLFNTLIR